MNLQFSFFSKNATNTCTDCLRFIEEYHSKLVLIYNVDISTDCLYALNFSFAILITPPLLKKIKKPLE